VRAAGYCFRGEADTSLSFTGCLEKVSLGLAVLRHNLSLGFETRRGGRRRRSRVRWCRDASDRGPWTVPHHEGEHGAIAAVLLLVASWLALPR